ncbi:MAG: hypothetical protein SFV15_11125 [Polyangiaceae bacterium]|nr:hypothetical protein [Polyangiaceae bacterium]
MLRGLKARILLGMAYGLTACGGRASENQPELTGTQPSIPSEGTAAAGSGGKASRGGPTSGGAAGIGGAPAGVGGQSFQVDLGIQPSLPSTPPPPRPPTTCATFCGLLAECRHGSSICENECNTYLHQDIVSADCYQIRMQALSCYENKFWNSRCGLGYAQQECGVLISAAEACTVPPSPPLPLSPQPPVDSPVVFAQEACESYCNRSRICSGGVVDINGCIDSCLIEVESYSDPCQAHAALGKECRASALTASCDSNAADAACALNDCHTYSCQFPTQMPRPYPGSHPPNGCAGSVN